MSSENPFDKKHEPYALDGQVPPEVSRATTLVQTIAEEEFNLVIDIDHTGSTGIVKIERGNLNVQKMLEAINMVIPETIEVTYDEGTKGFFISQAKQSLN